MQSYYEFSPLDEVIPPLYFAYILAFESSPNCRNTEQFFANLNNGLLRLVEDYPFLSGEITRDRSHTLRAGHLTLSISTPPEEIQIVKKDLRLPGSGWKDSYEELRKAGMPSSRLDARILAPLAAGVCTTRRVMSAQVNFIPGGTLLSVCFSHAFVDARGASIIIGLWAKICKSLQQDPSPNGETEPSRNGEKPTILKAQRLEADYEKLKTQPELWKLLGLDWKERPKPQKGALMFELPLVIPAAAPTAVGSGSSKVETQIFSFSTETSKKLKERATLKDSWHAEGNWISSNDALVAFLWQHIMRARFRSRPANSSASRFLQEESIVTVAIDGRKGLSVPENYIGNVVFCSMSSLSIGTLVASETGLPQLAQVVRQSVNKGRTTAFLTSAFALASCIPENVIRSLRYGFTDFVGKDLVTTSWVDLPFYEMDWGQAFGTGGYIDFFRMPRGQFEGICCMQPRRKDGTIEVVVGMKREHMGRLMDDEEFTRFAAVVGEQKTSGTWS
ncbi:MAG: hypothetical protein M1818_005163 [Claussenomyces sp. TS43310]|nr:MAG: hypothetical protein M1818_005163 [Claussenomyces sp. TS43310]